MTEVAPQIHRIPLFTKAFCTEIITAAEASGHWEDEAANDAYLPRIHGGPTDTVPTRAKPYACRVNEKEVDSSCDADWETKSCFSIQYIPGLVDTFNEMIDRHIVPLTQLIWPTYCMKIRRIPYILRYDASDDSLLSGMNLHWEQMAMAMSVYLNDDFEGGGTFFPRWDLTTGLKETGAAIFYPGGVSHEHGAVEISRGRRYVLICDFY